MSDGRNSAEMWQQVEDLVQLAYGEWPKAAPIDRLRIRPDPGTTLSHWPRTERRARSMLLQSLPEGLRVELIAERKITAVEVVYKLFTKFRPGGPSERVEILRQLTDTKVGNSAAEILTWTRQWRRVIARAHELGVQLPGSSRDVQHYLDGERQPGEAWCSACIPTCGV